MIPNKYRYICHKIFFYTYLCGVIDINIFIYIFGSTLATLTNNASRIAFFSRQGYYLVKSMCSRKKKLVK